MAKVAKFRFGKNAVIRVAPITVVAADGTVTKPATDTFKQLCLAKSVKIGLENGKVDIENFCTGGNTVSVRDGTQKGSMDLGESTWVEDDPALKIMEDASFAKTEIGGWVYVEVQPLGAGAGKPVYDLIIDVQKWELDIPSKGVITASHDIDVLEGPIKGILPA